MTIDQEYFELMLDAFPEFSDIFEDLTEKRREYDRTASHKSKQNNKMMKNIGVSDRPATPPPGRTWPKKGELGTQRVIRLKSEQDSPGGTNGGFPHADGASQSPPTVEQADTFGNTAGAVRPQGAGGRVGSIFEGDEKSASAEEEDGYASPDAPPKLVMRVGSLAVEAEGMPDSAQHSSRMRRSSLVADEDRARALELIHAPERCVRASASSTLHLHGTTLKQHYDVFSQRQSSQESRQYGR